MWDKRADMIVHEQDPYNAEPPRPGLGAAVTTLDSFYVRNHGPVPQRDEGTWRLTVDGLVESPLELSLAELRARFDTYTVTATMQCAGNRRAGLLAVRDIPGEDPWDAGATSTAAWTGVRLSDVLAAAGVQDDARFVEFGAPDVSQIADPPQAFGASIPLEKAAAGEVLLAWAMNGEPLPAVHGAPVRVVVPGYIGARSVKWVERVTVRTDASDNYFQATAYRLLPPETDPDTAGPADGPQLGPVALNSEILVPVDGARVSAGPLRVDGYAYAGDDRSVVRVDVSPDGGDSWAQARVSDPDSPWVWQHWTAELTLAPGDHMLVARAWDSTGACQPSSPEHLWNPKGYVNNSWPRLTVTAE